MEYVPSTTYFDEREERLLKEIKEAEELVHSAKAHFDNVTADLIARRNRILESTAQLRHERKELEARSKDARESIRELSALVLQTETLTAELATLLSEPEAQLATVDAEIADIESQIAKKTAKPAKAIEQLNNRLARLRVRRTLALKQAQTESSLPPTETV